MIKKRGLVGVIVLTGAESHQGVEDKTVRIGEKE
jgi:hypothetical protein